MIRFENISKIYRTRRGEIKALNEISFRAQEGEFMVVQGPSGSGKTTFLLTVGGMLRPTKGKVIVDGNDIYAMSERERAKFRAENIGFVFQMFHLVPYLSVMENILLASNVVKNPAGHDEARKILKRLQLLERENHKPTELSAGEKQRAAVARALLNRPKIILADEPTGNLDSENAAEVIEYMAEFHRQGGTIVVVTHGKAVHPYASCVINLRDGCIEAS